MADFYQNQQNKFHGNIDENMSLTDIFHTLAMNQQHGWLFLRSEDNTKEVYFYFQGDLVSLVSSPDHKFKYIPDKLHYAAKISIEEYNQAQMHEMPLVFLRELVDPMELESLKDSICYEEICEVFNWERGYFEFISQSHPEANPELIPISKQFEIEGVLMEIAQRRQEMQENASVLPEMDEILVQEQEIDGPKDYADPMFNVWFLAHHRSIQDIILRSYYNEFDVLRILNNLLLNGNLRPITDEELIVFAAHVEEQGDKEEAIQYYNLLLKRNPLDVQACDALAEIYNSLDRKEDQAILYRTAGERLLSQDDASLRVFGGVYLLRFCDILPESPEGIEMRTNLFYMVKDQEIDGKAIGYNSLAEGKKLFYSLRSRKEDEKARDILENLLALSPHDKTLQSQLINVCIDLDDIPTAVKQYESLAKIYERDKNWQELISTYQKIIKLVPTRKDIQKKLDSVQNKRQKGKKGFRSVASVFMFIFLIASAVGGYFWYSNWNNAQIENKNPILENDEIAKRRQEQVNSKAQQNLTEALYKKSRNQLREAEKMLLEIIATMPDLSIKQQVEAELETLRKQIKEREEISQTFEKEYFKAVSFEKQGLWNQAIGIYQDLWYNTKFQDIPERKNITFPILVQATPSGATVSIDGVNPQTIIGKELVVRCHPDFKQMEVSLEGYENRIFFNALRLPLAKPVVDDQGRTLEPILEGKIEVILAKSSVWTMPFSESAKTIMESAPCYADGMLFLAARDDRIYAFSDIKLSAKPQRMWVWEDKRARLASFSATPSYCNGILYVGGNNGRFYALDTKKQALIGLYPIAQNIPISAACDVSEKHGLVVLGAHDGKVYALPLIKEVTRKWQPRWVFSTTRRIDASIVIQGETVLVTSSDSYLYALDIATGKEIWRYDMDRASRCSPSVMDNMIYIAGNGYMRVVSLSNGKEIRKLEIQGDVLGQPVFYQNAVYFATNGRNLYAVSQNLQILWQYKAIAPFKASPAISKKGILYIGCQKGQKDKDDEKSKKAILYAFMASSGKIIWTHDIYQDIFASPLLVDDVLIQVSDKIYAFMDN
ncbi:MAG: PQQ-binding-like beta-propeller repeat protein [Candidatus Brocadiae bacterium]|nr:PQQ-binding-like beta-propeller repeat protein [Candidatus Brocadiia bacterium]